MSKEIEHDRLVLRLETYLRRSGAYYLIQHHIPYYEFSQTIGEIDVLAVNFHNFDLYEVKGSAERGSLQKAVEQLRTARLYFNQPGNNFIFTPQFGIESLDTVVQRLSRKMRNKKKER